MLLPSLPRRGCDARVDLQHDVSIVANGVRSDIQCLAESEASPQYRCVGGTKDRRAIEDRLWKGAADYWLGVCVEGR